MALIRLTRAGGDVRPAATTLTLPYDQRIKSRLRVTLDDGRQAGLFLDKPDFEQRLQFGHHLMMVAHRDSVVDRMRKEEVVAYWS